MIDPVALEDRKLIYGLQIWIKHPSINANIITDTLKLTPNTYWQAGQNRYSPAGTILEGVYKETYWSHFYTVKGERSFSKEINRLIGVLMPHKFFINRISDTNGRVNLNISLYSGENIGDVIPYTILRDFYELKIGLGIELF